MTTIDFEFEDVPLTLGKDASGKSRRIALITGAATINVFGRGRDTDWEIDAIYLQGPILKDPDVDISCSHPLWDILVNSINEACGDKIWDEANSAAAPDPDAARERMREDVA